MAESLQAFDITDSYFRLRILVNAYCLAGSHKVDSVMHPGTQVAFAPLDVDLNYAEACLA